MSALPFPAASCAAPFPSAGPGSEEAVPCADLPDTAVVHRLRTAQGVRGRQAEAELRLRHVPALCRYALLFCQDDAAAAALATEAFCGAVDGLRTGAAAEQPARLPLLLAVAATAAEWAASAQHRLAPGFLASLDRPAPGVAGGRGLTARAFRQLPEQTRAVLWHAVVEHDSPAQTARAAGVDPRSVPHLARSAVRELRAAMLRAHADVHATRHAAAACGHFTSLLDAATRRSGARASAALDGHLAHCRHCSRAREALAGIGEQADAVLARSLLPWGGEELAVASRAGNTSRPVRPPEPARPHGSHRRSPAYRRAPGPAPSRRRAAPPSLWASLSPDSRDRPAAAVLGLLSLTGLALMVLTATPDHDDTDATAARARPPVTASAPPAAPSVPSVPLEPGHVAAPPEPPATGARAPESPDSVLARTGRPGAWMLAGGAGLLVGSGGLLLRARASRRFTPRSFNPCRRVPAPDRASPGPPASGTPASDGTPPCGA